LGRFQPARYCNTSIERIATFPSANSVGSAGTRTTWTGRFVRLPGPGFEPTLTDRRFARTLQIHSGRSSPLTDGTQQTLGAGGRRRRRRDWDL